MIKKLLILSAVVILFVSGLPVFAQSTTAGGLTGTVTDSSGAALPGVTVELSGQSMQGTRTVISDGGGDYRFVNVPPGMNYSVAASLSGFQSSTKTVQRVFLGQEGTVNFVLQATMSETITVTAESPLVDVSKTTTGVNITSEQFSALPSARSFQQLTTMAPGVDMGMGTSRDSQLGNSPNVGASSAPENNYIIDGLSTTDARYGTSGTNLTMNFVEEVQVLTGGYSAEYGRSMGGVFNVITKSGGNEFHGDVFAYYSDADWSNKSIVRGQKGVDIAADVTESKDFGLSLGGPIMKDRLWFFGAYNPSRRTIDIGESSPVIGDGATEFDQDTDFYAAKLTFSASSNHSFVGTAFGDPTTQEGWLLRGLTAPPAEIGAATRKADIGSDNLNLTYNGILTQSWLVEANVGQHKQTHTLDPATSTGLNVPRQIDERVGGGFQRGGFQRFQNDDSTRDAFAVKFSNFIGNHELRYGIDSEKNDYSADLHETWYRFFGPTSTSRFVKECAGQTCDQYQERVYTVAGAGKTENQAFFLQDQWRVGSNLQFNLGVRYEEQKMSSARGVTTASNPDEVGSPHLQDSFTLDDNWAPRLGVIWDPTNDGRSKVFAYYGLFYEAIPLNLNIRALNGEDYIINDYQHALNANDTYWFNPTANPIPADVRSGPVNGPTGGGWTKYRARLLTQATATPLASDLKASYQSEYILGGERQFGNSWSLGIRYVNREIERVIEDFGVFGNPDDPLELTGYAIGNPGEGALGTPFPAPTRYYRAAEITLQRAYANNWQLYASYVYAKAQGNYEGLFMSGYEQLDPNILALYDIPSFLGNADGKLRADRPVNFKVHSSYTFPFGVTVSEGFYYSSGIPISALGPELYNGYGDGTIFLTTRGSEGRTPSFWNLDLHADYLLPFAKSSGANFSIVLDVLNATDNDETLEVDQDYVYQALGDLGPQYAGWFADENLDASGNVKFNASLPPSPYFGTSQLRQSPRTVQVGFKVTY